MASLDILSLVQTAVLAVVALILGLFVIRPILTSASRPALPPPEPALALPPSPAFGRPALEGEVDSGFVYDGYTAGSGSDDAAREDDPAARLRRLIEKRQVESIEILRGWMEHEEERA
jgi:flagellar M-ring protein FliF